jgi:acetoin utilization deacetylase AcuC-like enzyme
MIAQLKELGVPMVAALEGGYNFENLQHGAAATVRGMLGE